jgi:hypothetical protein
VHALPIMTHDADPHSNPPEPFGTHGTPLQQSDESAHAEPAIWHPLPKP